jgi:hypothetical protein
MFLGNYYIFIIIIYLFIIRSSGQMPKDVKQAFQEIAIKEGLLTQDDSNNFINQLEISKRYQTETWS